MHNAQQVAERIKGVLSSRKVSANKMLKETNLNSSLIVDMSKKGQMPSADKIVKIAEYLDVPTDWLFGLAVPNAPPPEPIGEAYRHAPEEIQRIVKFALDPYMNCERND